MTDTTQGDTNRRFDLGPILATPGALAALAAAHTDPLMLLIRHACCDWGDLDTEDKAANSNALITGARILSAYTLPGGDGKVWIITDAVIDEKGHRQATTILLPEEY